MLIVDQYSYELDKPYRTVFSYFLLMGIKGDADQNYDFTITTQELQDYLSEKVPAVVLDELGEHQHPQMNQEAYDLNIPLFLYR